MAGYENYSAETRDIELEIERRGVVLGIDWTNEPQVRQLAREAMDRSPEELKRAASSPPNYQALAKVELYGLAALMLKTMEESAGNGIESHGGVAWKAFAKALWAEAELRKIE